MTDNVKINPLSAASVPGLDKRYRTERNYRRVGMGAIVASLGFLAFLLISISIQGYGSFIKTEILFQIEQQWVDDTSVDGKPDSYALLRTTIRQTIPNISGRRDRREANGLVGANAEDALISTLAAIDQTTHYPIEVWLPASDDVDMLVKNVKLENAASEQVGLSEKQVGWIKDLGQQNRVRTSFNIGFLSNGDSRDAERAGVGGALLGSLFTLGICLLLSFFVGAFAAVYLEEFAPKNKLISFIEVNINNLASVPSIIFGLLGLAIFLNSFGLPRSSSLVGGMVLALMTLPTIIIASRISLQSVPPSIREAAYGVGASTVQAVFHHVIPLALPGMLTGTILGMARALGETAPLLMIGMVAFIADAPSGVLEPATALPVQVFLWSDSPERAFAEKTAGAIMVLIAFLIVMNLAAVLLRKKFEKKW